MFRAMLVVAVIALFPVAASAEDVSRADLAAVGLSGLQTVSDDAGMEIRGQAFPAITLPTFPAVTLPTFPVVPLPGFPAVTLPTFPVITLPAFP